MNLDFFDFGGVALHNCSASCLIGILRWDLVRSLTCIWMKSDLFYNKSWPASTSWHQKGKCKFWHEQWKELMINRCWKAKKKMSWEESGPFFAFAHFPSLIHTVAVSRNFSVVQWERIVFSQTILSDLLRVSWAWLPQHTQVFLEKSFGGWTHLLLIFLHEPTAPGFHTLAVFILSSQSLRRRLPNMTSQAPGDKEKYNHQRNAPSHVAPHLGGEEECLNGKNYIQSRENWPPKCSHLSPVCII